MNKTGIPVPVNRDEQITMLCELDSCGFFMNPQESFADFLVRVDAQKCRAANYRTNAPIIPGEIMNQALVMTSEKYGFKADWIPAFFSTQETGKYSSGILLIHDDFFPVIFLNEFFEKCNISHGYNRAEILAHEITHAVRIPLGNSCYDEYFPWQFDHVKLRRLSGNFFRSKYLVAAFFLGITLAVFHPVFLVMSLYAVWAEIRLHILLQRARIVLERAGFDAEKVLIRLTDQEIRLLSRSKEIPQELWSSLRWQVFDRRFRRN